MNFAKPFSTAVACTLGLGLITIKDAYGSGDSDSPETEQTEQTGEESPPADTERAQGAGAEVVDIESIDLVLPKELHGQRLAVPAKLFKPVWSKEVGKKPAVLVMHGSGGLTKMPNGKGADPCSPELEPQFQRWGERLAERGYVVLMPSSYSARGFCDMHVDTDRIPSSFDDRPEAVLSRIYDMDAASRYLCDLDEVDCDRMGVLGFSHGATMAMLALHWQMDHALEYYREHSRDKVDIDIPDLAPGRPEFQVGVAYYPGCGTDGVLPKETDDRESIYNKYFPTADLYVLHASEDPLAKICTADSDMVKNATGERQIQSAQVAAKLGVSDPYHIKVYPHANHGFDNDGKPDGKETTDAEGNATARDKALVIALDKLSAHLN